MWDCMNLIEEKLWLGGVDAALDNALLKEKGIVSVVTVDASPLPDSHLYNYLYIFALDLYFEDLLSHFTKVIDFIEEAKSRGSVLVHCQLGVSRSATLVLSYFISKYKISVSEAFARVKAARHIIEPNHGFMSQLMLFESLVSNNCFNSIPKQLYVMQNLTFKRSFDQESLQKIFASKSTPNSQVSLHCKHCRFPLANYEDLIVHRTRENPNWKDQSWVKFAVGKNSLKDSCKMAYLVTPLPWMCLNNQNEGKLLCPQCSGKLGTFNWSKGGRCPCAASITPLFYFITSKVDIISSKEIK